MGTTLAPSMPVYGVTKQAGEDLQSLFFYQKIIWNLMCTQQDIARYYRRIYPMHVIWGERLKVGRDKEEKSPYLYRLTPENQRILISEQDLPEPVLKVGEDERVYLKPTSNPTFQRRKVIEKKDGTKTEKWVNNSAKYSEFRGSLLGTKKSSKASQSNDYTILLQNAEDLASFVPNHTYVRPPLQAMKKEMQAAQKVFFALQRNGFKDARPPTYKRHHNHVTFDNANFEVEFPESTGYGKLRFRLFGKTHMVKFRGFPEYMRNAEVTSVKLSLKRDGSYKVALRVRAEAKPADSTIQNSGMVCALDWGMKNDAFLTVKLTNASKEAEQAFLDDLTDNEFEWASISGHTAAYEIFHPRHMRSADIEDKLIYLQQQLSPKVGSRKGEKWSKSYRAIQKKINKEYGRIKARRDDWIQKLTKILVRHFNEIVTETIDWKGMKENSRDKDKNRRTKTRQKMADMAPSKFFTLLESKAMQHGKSFVAIKTSAKVAPSQQCSSCHTKNPAMKSVSKRIFTCKDPSCKYTCHRDVNACQNMLIEAGYLGFVLLHQDRGELERRKRIQYQFDMD